MDKKLSLKDDAWQEMENVAPSKSWVLCGLQQMADVMPWYYYKKDTHVVQLVTSFVNSHFEDRHLKLFLRIKISGKEYSKVKELHNIAPEQIKPLLDQVAPALVEKLDAFLAEAIGESNTMEALKS